MSVPSRASPRHELAEGIDALPGALLWIESTRSLVVADAHFGYEEVVGGALPLWSTGESVDVLLAAIARYEAREPIFLGDVVHGARMSEGSAAIVRACLDALRARCTLTIVAGNHEGATRAKALLGPSEEVVERGGWLLLHGDDATGGAHRRRIVGHLHPSLALGGDRSAPCFVGASRTIVVPAFTPYSRGLDVLSQAGLAALASLGILAREAEIVADGRDRVLPFGRLSTLRGMLRR